MPEVNMRVNATATLTKKRGAGFANSTLKTVAAEEVDAEEDLKVADPPKEGKIVNLSGNGTLNLDFSGR